MTQPRTTRRVLAAALSVGALLVTAACSSGTAASPAASGSAAARPPTGTSSARSSYAQGKDTSGTLTGELKEWNDANPNEQVEFRELSDNADEQRAAMVQRGQSKSGEFTVMSVDVVWTRRVRRQRLAARNCPPTSSPPPAT